MLEFRILGPLEAHADGKNVRLGSQKQRALLALLLLEGGRVVSSDRLIDALWAGEPPATASASLQNFVSQLRRTLVGGDRDQAARLSRPAGVGRARPRAGASTRRRSAGKRSPRRARLLGEALSLWRGEALEELAYEEFAQPEVARLAELRMTLEEERAEAELAIGRHGELVSELERLVREHPLRERLRGQLMLALYRAGRQADALEVYRSGRETLVEHLGIEPSPLLQRLHGSILRQEASPRSFPGPHRTASTSTWSRMSFSPAE